MWKREVDGRVLTFHLAGINNQNFLMRDEETGSFWQQVSGLAISGPLRGKQLELVHADEITFGLWREEYANGTVLRPVARHEKSYAPKDWELRMRKSPTVVSTKSTGIAERELMVGLMLNGQARAYPWSRVIEAKLIQDYAGGVPVILAIGRDGKSLRVFEAKVRGQSSNFYRELDGARFRDAETGSIWDFTGCAIEGSAAGQCLKPITAVKDYWFDWRLYHPNTTVLGQ